MPIRLPLQFSLFLLFLVAIPVNLLAAGGDPVAVRKWTGGVVSVETQWGLHLVIDPSGNSEQHLQRKSDQTVSPDNDLDHVLSRQANAAAASWTPVGISEVSDANAMHVKTIRQLNGQAALLIEVDGVRILYVPARWFLAQSSQDSISIKMKGIEKPDLMILDCEHPEHLTDQGTATLLNIVKPKRVLFNRIDPADDSKVKTIQDQYGGEKVVVHANRNTIAMSNSAPDSEMQFLAIGASPWQMPDSLSGLFAAMEKANEDSQAVFSNLSANQMNFKPANGTHTPRWNSEHMMG